MGVSDILAGIAMDILPLSVLVLELVQQESELEASSVDPQSEKGLNVGSLVELLFEFSFRPFRRCF